MSKQERVLCAKCLGPAVMTRTLDHRETGVVTVWETRCESPDCGEETRSALPGDHTR
ncbi:hypothetical protein [Terrabacter sp. Root85]|uniref:hypothetical protein n=1 Tax=Terrabacter sp. Root85 TaxID=1736603 RepID=UPI000B1EF181|nr:hypothetical protein [Terrabacter sp. Root85]